MGKHIHILGAHDECPLARFLYGKRRVGALFFRYRIVPAAWLCALTAVCVSAHEIIREKATPAEGNAHRAMNKSLYLHIRRDICPYRADIGKRKLTGYNRALRSEPVPCVAVGGADYSRLRGNMNLHIGDYLLYHVHDADIRNYRGIGHIAECFQFAQKIGERCVFVLSRHGIERDIELPSALMRIGGSLLYLGQGEIVRRGTHAEAFARKIYGVGSVEKSGAQFFGIARGRE